MGNESTNGAPKNRIRDTEPDAGLIVLKARAYDLICIIEAHGNEMRKHQRVLDGVNDEIRALTEKQAAAKP